MDGFVVRCMKAPVLNDQHFEQLEAYALGMERPGHYLLLLRLSRELGLRPMEIAGLQRSWFRGNHPSYELRIPLGYSKRKSGRSLPVSVSMFQAVQEHMAGRDGAVFLNQRGLQFEAGGITEAFRRLYRLAGVQGSAYSGRRTLATRLVDKGVNIAVVQLVLVH